MMTDRRGIPLQPMWPNAGDVIVRAATAALLGHRRNRDPIMFASKAWSRDSAVGEILKAATSPATLTSASALTQSAVADFIGSLGAASAAAAVLDRAVKVSFDSYVSILVPGIVSDASNCAFVGEGQPIPVRAQNVGGVRLDPKKLMALITFTNEVLERSTPDVENLVRVALTESVGLALDSYLFDATAGDTVRPAGLRYGISALTASAATNPADAMRADVAALVGSVGSVGGNAPVLLVAGARNAAALRLMLVGPSPGFEVLTSGAVADGIVIAIAPSAVAHAVDPVPEFVSSREVLIHEFNNAAADRERGNDRRSDAIAVPNRRHIAALALVRLVGRALAAGHRVARPPIGDRRVKPMPFSKEELSALLATADADARQEIAAALKAESIRVLAEADEALATRHEPLTNVIPLPRKPPPEPPRAYYTDEVVNRMIGELREQLDEHRDYVNGELCSLLHEVFSGIDGALNAIGDRFEAVDADMRGFVVGKAIETDVAALQDRVATLEANNAALTRTVEAQGFEISAVARRLREHRKVGEGGCAER